MVWITKDKINRNPLLINAFHLKEAFVLIINIGAVVSHLQELALSLALKCLSFDFVGTTIDESSEEFGTVQVG